MGPKLAIALPVNLPDCAGDSPIAQPDADCLRTAAWEPPQQQQHFAAPFGELEAHPLAPSHPEADKLLMLYRNLEMAIAKAGLQRSGYRRTHSCQASATGFPHPAQRRLHAALATEEPPLVCGRQSLSLIHI